MLLFYFLHAIDPSTTATHSAKSTAAATNTRQGKSNRTTLHLLERDESGGVGGSDTGASVSDGSVSDGELAKVVADHLGADINMVEHLAVVHSDLGVDHLGHNEHVAQVGLDHSGLVDDTALCRHGRGQEKGREE